MADPTTAPVPTSAPVVAPTPQEAPSSEGVERQQAAAAQPTVGERLAATALSRLGFVEAAAVLEMIHPLITSNSGRARFEASQHLAHVLPDRTIPKWIISEVRGALNLVNQASITAWFSGLKAAINSAQKAVDAGGKIQDRNLRLSLGNQVRARVREGREALHRLSAPGWVERALWREGLKRLDDLRKELDRIEVLATGLLADRR